MPVIYDFFPASDLTPESNTIKRKQSASSSLCLIGKNRDLGVNTFMPSALAKIREFFLFSLCWISQVRCSQAHSRRSHSLAGYLLSGLRFLQPPIVARTQVRLVRHDGLCFHNDQSNQLC